MHKKSPKWTLIINELKGKIRCENPYLMNSRNEGHEIERKINRVYNSSGRLQISINFINDLNHLKSIYD